MNIGYKGLGFIVILVTIISVLSSCQSKKYTLEDLPEKQIIVGSGGGFAGVYNHYIFLDNGQVFKHFSVGDTTVSYGKLKKPDSKELWTAFEALQFDSISLISPGNMSYFVEHKIAEKAHRVTWGGGDKVPPDNVADFFQQAMRLIKGMKGVEIKPEDTAPAY